ncbi:hypothetical protein DIPPA_08085 [Diplonema papillatum]|nr:hypothetical protein DIPPA_08085 [Diplonema papillatum]KAJ9473297.1 hypothetical protein DIPPA_08085 [Diplonema papillatum]|eukprot:gene11921-18390_t
MAAGFPTNYGYQVPYQRQATGYNPMDAESRKRKLQENWKNKKIRRDEEYEFNKCAEANGTLYKKVEDANGVKYDCAVCKMFVAAYAFYTHVVSQEHKNSVKNSKWEEDQAFIDAERQYCVEAERQATGAVLCEPCKRYINPSCWEAHIKGKPHRHAQGLPPLATTPTSSSTINTNTTRHPASAFRTGNDSVNGPLLDSFEDQENIPLFCVGEDMWKLDLTYNDANVAVVEEYKTEMCLIDQKRWGSKAGPAMGPALVFDPEKCALGVCYKITRATMNELCDVKKPENVKLVEVTVRIEEEQTRAVAFCIKNHVPIDVESTAKYVASAIGPQGANFGLLTRVVHELEKQDWKDPYFKDLLTACNKLIWKA